MEARPYRLRIALAILFGAALLVPAASAQTFTTLFTFDLGDGAFPGVGLIRDAKGNLYGTTYAGGVDNCFFGCGLVFKVDTSGNETVLYAFTGSRGDGETPDASLVMDESGTLYGTTVDGGASSHGTVFKVNKSGKETVLYSFTGSGRDGKYPFAGLLRDAYGNLYGTNIYSGNTSCNDGAGPGCGTVFKVDNTGKETVLYNFTGINGDGSYPIAGLVQDKSGTMYGTTYGGGDSGRGTVFKLTKSGKESVLYSFSGGADGGFPEYGYLALDSKGNLYGTTSTGGSGAGCSGGCGVVFKVDKAGKETVLYSFAGENGDGANPYAGVVLDSAGNLYGTTFRGGQSVFGTVFKLDKTGKETVLHSFDDTDGANPHGDLVLDGKGNLYGAAQSGGEFDFGTVFKLKP